MTAWIAVKTVFSTVRFSTMTLVSGHRGQLTPQRADTIIRRWAQALLDHAELGVEVSGLERIRPNETYVVMSNHQSLYDIPALTVGVPLTLRIVAKSELFRIPLWSHAMLASGYVPIHRDDPTKVLQDLRNAQRALESGVSILVFPEGTRSADGQLGDFKPGGFHLASAVKSRILPVGIGGTRDALPPKAFNARTGVTAKIVVGDPIDPKSFGRKDRQGLQQAVRNAISELMDQGRAH
ncbi:MAG TPA: lysophospholipid acyltransferase family protein [Polyangiaceae bacterium]|nr:lysophospholipid acyltransferase family protein [Polyangiaceae bacterium]